MSFASGFRASFSACTLAVTCWFIRHPIAGVLFTVTQHGLGIYFLGWYWLALCIVSTVLSVSSLKLT